MEKKLKLNRQKNSNGITLIALVVTIIVLIILAGISINLILGENGIIAKARGAKEKQEQAQIEEEYGLTTMEEFINESASGIEIEQVTDEKPGILEGTGTESDPYVINSIEDLVLFGYNVINGNTYEGEYIRLGVNLNFKSTKSYVNALREDYEKYGYSGQLIRTLTTGEGFKPIGTINDFKNEEGKHTTTNYFKGTFDGNNKIIYNLYMNIERDYAISIGLFSFSYGSIKKLGLINCNILGNGTSPRVAGICGWNYGEITGCYTKGTIASKGINTVDAGGICCILDEGGTIKQCYNTANIYVENKTQTSEAIAGGIAAQIKSNAQASIEECYNSGNVKSNGENVLSFAAGITSSAITSLGTIKNCYNLGNIESYSVIDARIGGIVADIEKATLFNCYNMGEIKIIGEEIVRIGGIGGRMRKTSISNVFNMGNIIIEIEKSENTRIGGITSENYSGGSIINAYNIGNIITNGYETETIGSILGHRDETEISGCSYLKGTYSRGIGDDETQEGVKEEDSINNFPKVIEIVNTENKFKEDTNNINNGYPILNWQ